ncbi:MAG TPA: Rieske 2Fe-2S domain-containing protein [Mycobacteriales bacterium]|nr:Rieske 2Fe-2S domain-containing protein [Mycobacteriales bacterium]
MTTPDEPSVRDRLRAPAPSDEANAGGDSRHSDISDSSVQPTDSRAQLQAQGGGEQQLVATHSPAAPAPAPHRKPYDPRAARAAERNVALLFLLSVLGVFGFCATYVFWPNNYGEDHYNLYTPLLGTCMAIGLGGLGAGVVKWAKSLMTTEEAVQERHTMASTDEERIVTAKALTDGLQESQLGRRPLLLGSLVLAGLTLPLMAVPFLFSLGRYQHKERALSTTAWRKGMRLVRENGTPVKMGDLELGSIEIVFPDVEHRGNAIADSGTMLLRMRPEAFHPREGRENWTVDGHVAYSAICTHLGCPVKLYEQQTNYLFCPCHQSTFDAGRSCKVLFGPAARPLPQLPITLDDEGYFIAQSDYQEPIGPSYWERGRR